MRETNNIPRLSRYTDCSRPRKRLIVSLRAFRRCSLSLVVVFLKKCLVSIRLSNNEEVDLLFFI